MNGPTRQNEAKHEHKRGSVKGNRANQNGARESNQPRWERCMRALNRGFRCISSSIVDHRGRARSSRTTGVATSLHHEERQTTRALGLGRWDRGGLEPLESFLQALTQALAFPLTADVIHNTRHPIALENVRRRTMDATSAGTRRVLSLWDANHTGDVWRRLRDNGSGRKRRQRDGRRRRRGE